jgi:hypothetical protein
VTKPNFQIPTTSSAVLYELNEVPWKVVDWYIKRKPESNLAKLLRHSISLTSVTHDEGELHPWTTWPTFHRGVYNTSHRIQFLNQDRSCADAFPPIWEILAKAGKRVGVFGSLQSYPKPDDMKFSFYVPDTFAPGPETYPQCYEPFQRVNLRQTRNDGAVATNVSIDSNIIRDLFLLKLNGLSISTCLRLAKHLLQEKMNVLYRTRRPMMQAPVAFDVFRHALLKHAPDFSTFFTNHVAGTMHRYWKYAFPEDFNYEPQSPQDLFHAQSLVEAMNIADEQIGFLRQFVDERNGSLIVASSMGQEAIEREYNGEIRIDDSDKFADAIGFKSPFKAHLAMQPDFNFEFGSPQDRDDFIQRINNLVDFDEKPIFHRVRVQNLTVNLGLGSPADLIEKEVVLYKSQSGENKEIPFSKIGFKSLWRDVGTGYHQPKGILIWYNKKLQASGNRAEIESAEIAPIILKSMGVEPAVVA